MVIRIILKDLIFYLILWNIIFFFFEKKIKEFINFIKENFNLEKIFFIYIFYNLLFCIYYIM